MKTYPGPSGQTWRVGLDCFISKRTEVIAWLAGPVWGCEAPGSTGRVGLFISYFPICFYWYVLLWLSGYCCWSKKLVLSTVPLLGPLVYLSYCQWSWCITSVWMVGILEVALRSAGWRLWLLLLFLPDWNLMGEKLWNLFPIPRPISCWDPTVTPCGKALETKHGYRRVLQCLFALLTCTVFSGGKNYPRLLL